MSTFYELIESERENLAIAQTALEHVQRARSRTGLTRTENRDLDAAERLAERVARAALGTLCRAKVASEIAKNR